MVVLFLVEGVCLVLVVCVSMVWVYPVNLEPLTEQGKLATVYCCVSVTPLSVTQVLAC